MTSKHVRRANGPEDMGRDFGGVFVRVVPSEDPISMQPQALKFLRPDELIRFLQNPMAIITGGRLSYVHTVQRFVNRQSKELHY